VTVQCHHGEGKQDEQIVVPLPGYGRVQDLLKEANARAKRWPKDPVLYLFDEADRRWARLDNRDSIERVVTSGDKLLVKSESSRGELPRRWQSNCSDRSSASYSSYSLDSRSSSISSPARSEGDTFSRRRSPPPRGCRDANRGSNHSRSRERVRVKVETNLHGGRRRVTSCCPSAASNSEAVPYSARSRRSGRPWSRAGSVAAATAHGSEHMFRRNMAKNAARTGSSGECPHQNRTWEADHNTTYTNSRVESEPWSKFPQVFWMRPPQLKREYLCIAYTEEKPLGTLLADAGGLMNTFGKDSNQPSLDDSMQGEPPAEHMRAGLPDYLYWTVGKNGGSFDCIGIGRNKKVRHKATKLAISVGRCCEADTKDFSWAPELFKELVDHACSTRSSYFSDIPRSAIEEGTQPVRWDRTPVKLEPCKKPKRKDGWTEHSTDSVDNHNTHYDRDVANRRGAEAQDDRWRKESKPWVSPVKEEPIERDEKAQEPRSNARQQNVVKVKKRRRYHRGPEQTRQAERRLEDHDGEFNLESLLSELAGLQKLPKEDLRKCVSRLTNRMKGSSFEAFVLRVTLTERKQLQASIQRNFACFFAKGAGRAH